MSTINRSKETNDSTKNSLLMTRDRDADARIPTACYLCLLPAQRTFDGALPASIEGIALALAHLRLEGTIDGPMLGEFLLAAPEADGQAREVSSAERSGLGDLRTLDRYAKNIGLELHE